MDKDLLTRGTVFRVHSGNYYVRDAEGVDFVCKLRGNLKKEFTYSTSNSRAKRVTRAKKRQVTDAIAVGDTVLLDPDQLIIEEVGERHSDLSRHSPSRRGQHTLVANLDQVFIVFAATDPNPDLWLLDKFIVMSEASDIDVRIVVNKVDLVQGKMEELHALFGPYTRIGYPIYYISARSGDGLDALRQELPNRISAVTGPSGVGKSNILNALIPGATRVVGVVGKITGAGRHTTTTSELIPVPGIKNGWIADTPGLRQLEFWKIDREEISDYFLEFDPYRGKCRFNDCSHQNELGCEIRAAMEAGIIDARRYESYLQLLNPIDDRY